ncbi:MAG: hypothetical protein V3R24_08050 [Gemmatimonadales bacterium]
MNHRSARSIQRISKPTFRIWIPKISASLTRKFSVVLLFLIAPRAVEAQQFTVHGQVIHVGANDSTPVVGGWATLHQVTLAGGGPVDSTRTNRAGRYRLQASEFDSTAIYVVSAEHDGIAYFTLPIRPSGGDAGTAEPLLVYDTSSTVPELHLAQRHVIVRPRSSEGTFRVLEILVLENRGRLTRISPDSVTPVWLGAIPEGAIQFQVGESDVSDQAVTRRGDSVAVIAPVPPGDRQIIVSYLLPEETTEFSVPIDNPVGRLNVLVGDTAALVTATLADMGIEVLEDIPFVRYEGFNVVPGTPIAIRFGRVPISPDDLVLPVVLLAALILVGFLLWWLRGTRSEPQSAGPEVIAARIAAIDAELDGEPAPSAAKRSELQRTRDRLKRELSRSLATKGEVT